MSFFSGPTDANAGPDTEYAYNENWSHLKIINLNALKSYRDIENPWVDFKAFVKSFRDNFTPGWQEVQYPNQSVPIAHQSMPKRSIQIEWSVPSFDAKDAIMNLQKCSWLAQSMYPTLKKRSRNKKYTPRSTFMGIKFANLIQANDGTYLPGYITSFSYTPNITEGVHILSKKQAPRDLQKYFIHSKGKHLFPNLVEISIEFKPIQTRDSFGLVESGTTGWNNSSWPYGVKIDKKLGTGTRTTSTGQGTGVGGDVNVANESKVTQ